MAAKKYLKQNSGAIVEQAATVTSTGVSNAGDLVALDDNGQLDSSLMPTGIGADVAIITASESLSAGDLVNVHSSSGAKVRKADASTAGKEAMGFVLASVTSGNPATVYFEGTNNQVTGLTPGKLYLSTTPGLATDTAPSSSGNVVQIVGFATSSSSFNFQSLIPITLA